MKPQASKKSLPSDDREHSDIEETARDQPAIIAETSVNGNDDGYDEYGEDFENEEN